MKITDLVYPESRYVEGCSPIMMFIPGKHLLFKMQRACLGCKNENDLWFNRAFGCDDDDESQSDHVDYENMVKPEEMDDGTDSDATPGYRGVSKDNSEAEN